MELEQEELEQQQNDQQTQDDQQQSGEPIDNNVAQQPYSVQTPAIDMNALYMDSVRQRQRLEQELENLRLQQQQSRQVPQQQVAPDVTDADLERLGTVETIRRVVNSALQTTLPQQLQQTLGDIPEISRDYQRSKQLNNAEDAFFAQMPHLAPYRNAISSTVRQSLQNAPQIDPAAYATQAFATIGYYTAMSSTQPQQPMQTQPPVPSRQSPPLGRTAGAPAPANTRTPRLSEMERSAIRKAGYDPNKAEDIKAFFDEVNNDEGISV